jgi:hypothetical protein
MMWRNLDDSRSDSVHYSVFGLIDPNSGMDALRAMFPEGKADDLNFVLFSTSGVHGTYSLIEATRACATAEKDEACSDVTFVIVHPRLVCMRYGNAEPKTLDDVAFLKALRESSWLAASKIGRPTESAQ